MVQYADDTILIMPACPTQVACMKKILLDYADSIGLKINFHKSMMVPMNVHDDTIAELAPILQCAAGTMPFTYLGLPMGTT